ncbi:MAG: cytochrome c [Gammaproteobacteria bacterium]|nr:hypothetical protein [Gammaproteobacteria bacterium]
MTRTGIAACIATLGAAAFGTSFAQDASTSSVPDVADTKPLPVEVDHPGRELFERNCAPCHAPGPGDDGAPMLPGTAALAAKYQGQRYGALELRGDLDANVLRYFVRNGIGAMPMFRKVELSDADIDLIAAYLEASAEANLSRR